MKIHLTRHLQNRTFTHGQLHIQGFPDTIDTLELAIPRNRQSYVRHCLPPGEYPLQIQSSLLALQNGNVRRPWPSFTPIKWFPKASFISSFTNHYPPSGAIYIGKATNDEFSIQQDDLATVHLIVALSTIFDTTTNTTTQPVTLVITESPDLIIHDYDEQQYAQLQADLLEQQHHQQAESLLQQLINQSQFQSQFQSSSHS